MSYQIEKLFRNIRTAATLAQSHRFVHQHPEKSPVCCNADERLLIDFTKLFIFSAVSVHELPQLLNSLFQAVRRKKSGKGAKPEVPDNKKDKEEFEAMKKKTKGILIGMIAAVVAAVAGALAYKATH